MTIDSFETPRLIAERLSLEHLPELLRMHGDPRIMATLGGVRDRTATMVYLDRNLAHWTEFGFGTWMLRDRSRGGFAGRAALRHVKVDDVEEVELGYALNAEFWRRGLATEIARACLHLGKVKLALPSIVALTPPDHLASRRVMQKAGLRYERSVLHGGTVHVLYRTPPP